LFVPLQSGRDLATGQVAVEGTRQGCDASGTRAEQLAQMVEVGGGAFSFSRWREKVARRAG
jgi:hypothetical protein